MDQAISLHPYCPLSSYSVEVPFACDSEDKNEPTEGLYGPGRTVGKFLDAAGARIDRSLRKSVKRDPSPPNRMFSQSVSISRSLHHEQDSVSFDVAFVCDRGRENDPIEGLYGPGRTIRKYLDIAGRRIDGRLSKVAEGLGYGPRVTAEKIRGRRRVIQHSFRHQDGSDPHECSICRLLHEEFLLSPDLNKTEAEKLKKDATRLLRYVKSNVPLTRRQAVDQILELSSDYDAVQALFKQLDAINIIENVIRVYSAFRYSDFDTVVLSSSRKILVSLRDTKLNSLLREWSRYNFLSARFEKPISLWQEIAPFLYDREVAFLIYRVLSLDNSQWCLGGPLTRNVIGDIASCIPNMSDYFEWDNFESIFNTIFIHFDLNTSSDNSKSIAMDYVLRFARRTSRVLTMTPFKELSTSIDKIEHGFRRVHLLKAAIMRADTSDQEEHHQAVPEYLQEFRGALACPVQRVVCDYVWDNPEFGSYSPTLFSEIASYIDAHDAKLRAKAWEYANYYLSQDLEQCDLMLRALSTTNFAAEVDFVAFKKQKRTKHFLSKAWDRETVYRHVDESNSRLRLRDELWSSDISHAEQLEFAKDWVSNIVVNRGTTFSAGGSYPLIAIRNANGTCSYVARHVPPQGCCTRFNNVRIGYGIFFPFTVTEGTKPEDLRVKLRCSHQKRLFVPDSFEVLALKYPPEEYPDGFFVDNNGVDATGPYSWKPAEKDNVRLRPYTGRVMIAEEAEEGGMTSDDDDYISENASSTGDHNDSTSSIGDEGGDCNFDSGQDEGRFSLRDQDTNGTIPGSVDCISSEGDET